MVRRLLFLFSLIVIVEVAQGQTPLLGKGMWIWKVWTADSGNLPAVIDKLKSIGVQWAVIKLADSDSYYNRNGQSLYAWASAYGGFQGVVNIFHANGIKILGYQYVCGLPRWGVGPTEYDVANVILGVAGIDGLVVDAETEFDTLSTRAMTAHTYMDSIRAQHPNSYVALTSWARVGGHTTFPWVQFLTRVNANVPQTYWAARPTSVSNELNLMSSDFTAYTQAWINQGYPATSKPILPLGQGEYFGYGDDVAVGDVAAFLRLSQSTYAYPGASLWEYNQINHSYVWDEYAAAWPLTSVCGEPQTASNYELEQNYPNPFNPATIITYRLQTSGHVLLMVYDLLGRKIATLVDGSREAGSHQVAFDAGSISGGVYFCRLSAGGQVLTKKMVVVK